MKLVRGNGTLKIEMHFLPDVLILVLSVKGKDIMMKLFAFYTREKVFRTFLI